MKARRWSDTAAFRADPSAAPAVRPSRRQTVGLLVVLLLIAGAAAAASYLVRPDKARAFDLVHGSVFLEDTYAPVGIDLASGKPTVRILNAPKQVGASNTRQLSVVPLEGSTLLLNNGTDSANSGEFNEVDQTGFVVKPDGSGVTLNSRADSTTSVGYRVDDENTAIGSAFIERTGPAGTDVFLINQGTITQALPGKVKPRASISLSAVADSGPGSGASANGDLWLLLRGATGLALNQLTVPTNSTNGAELHNVPHATVDEHAAIGVADEAGSSTAKVVGVAEPTKITIYRPGSKKKVTAPTHADDADTILPATNQGDRLTYLLRSGTGWSVVSVRSDGGDERHAALPGIPQDAQLAQPAQSGDALYTVDRSGGEIYQIDLAGALKATGIGGYPKQTGEAAGLDDAYAVSRGPRVIVNSPGHAEALVLFTDGSRDPLVVRKSMAVDIDSTANATTFTKYGADRTTQGAKPKGSSGAQPKSQPISTRVDCKTVNQKPHIPAITGATPGSRSVALAWTYPLLDQQDCVPSTYQVRVKLLSNDAPQPDGTVNVQGQQSVNIAGLYPSSRYELTVIAALNKLSTPSRSLTVTTGPEGPAAPTGVSASADAAGNWTVRWSGCGTVSQGCVPAASWRVIPSFCDGVGLSGAPTPLNVPADPTTKTQAPALYKGNDGLLGRGLRFQIEGSGQQGAAGTPSAQSACVFSRSPANVAAMTLNASTANSTAFGASAPANVTLNLGSNPTRDVGGYGADITITLSGPGSPQTKSFVFNGNQTVLSADFTGVQAGAVYSASATVTPAHGGATATVAPKTLQTRADWPAISLSASCKISGLTCTPSIQISGISSNSARGERFTLEGDINCKSANEHFQFKGINPASGPLFAQAVSQTTGFYSSCPVTAALRESSSRTPLVFGGSIGAVRGTTLDFGDAKVLGATAQDFTATWVDQTPYLRVTYTGGGDVADLSRGWSEAVAANSSDSACGSGSTPPPATVPVSVPCIQDHGPTNQWRVAIQYTDAIGNGGDHSFTVDIPNPPSYVAPKCTPTQFGAAWEDSQAGGINVTYGGDPTAIGPCTKWSISLKDGSGADICAGSTVHDDPPPANIGYADCGIPPAKGWSVHITWQDTDGNAQSADVPVPGDPPVS